MDSKPIFSTLRTGTAGLRFSYAVLLALAANFMWAGGHDQQRIIELVVLGLALAIGLVNGAVPRALQALPASLRGLCLAFLMLGAAASVGVVSPRHALTEWSMFVLLGLSAILVAAEIAMAGTSGLSRLLQMIGLVCALYSLRVLLVYSAGITARVQLDFHALAVGFSNARFLNHTQTALLPMLVLLSRPTARTRVPAKCFFLITAFWWALVFVSEARSTMLGLVVGAIVTLALRRQVAKGWMLTMAMSAIAGLVLYLTLFIALPSVLGMAPFDAPANLITRSAADPASGRQFLWRRALELIAQHPLLGVGPQHFAHFGCDLHIGAHPHDWLLQVATEWGVPAWLCMMAILLLGARALARAAARVSTADLSQQDIATTLVVTVFAVVVDGLFSGVLVMPQSQLAIALVFGIVIGWTRSLQPVMASAVTTATRYIGILLCLLALGIAIAVVGPDLGRKWQNEPLDAQEQAHNEGAHWPRLWEAGYF